MLVHRDSALSYFKIILGSKSMIAAKVKCGFRAVRCIMSADIHIQWGLAGDKVLVLPLGWPWGRRRPYSSLVGEGSESLKRMAIAGYTRRPSRASLSL